MQLGTIGISGVEFEDYYASRIVDTLDGKQVNIINLKHLKINKKAAGRLKDLADLENLPNLMVPLFITFPRPDS